ncbi:hypothetical protein OPV22_022249 [Ensete ventricosum]|uniref:Uncharacterized protein n=1 Tax=Ensete ventricosum TaxID=4639 RepID=A0AAV8QSG6_ENSVE|nr:hypothetical protein OPV22_022249 [Ensete ventricosum]
MEQLTSSEKEIHDGEHVAAAPKKGRGEGRKEERPFESSILISSSHVLMAIHLSQANSTGRRKQHCGAAVACFGASPLTEQRLG